MKNRILLLVVALTTALSAQAFSEKLTQMVGNLDYSGKADSLEHVLIEQFMNKNQGYFYSTPQDVEKGTQYIYWQQAHAIDVIATAYERVKGVSAIRSYTYKQYLTRWYASHGNNYHHDSSDKTGFLNPYTDDMAWICLALLRISEALEDSKYAQTAKTVYDQYIITRATRDEKGVYLPWNWDRDANGNYKNPNGGACTNGPSCLLAAKLYEIYGEEKYLTDAIDLYDFMVKYVCKSDGRCEEPPLTYTQGVFGEACRRLYHITGKYIYKNKASLYLRYAINSDRCNHNGILRNEGTSMDQAIFKAVLIPYLVNYVLDEDLETTYRKEVLTALFKNVDALWKNLDKSSYPKMYCPYYWGEKYDASQTASMGAMVSGASLMENVARMCNYIRNAADGIEQISSIIPSANDSWYNLQGQRVGNNQKGILIHHGKKVLKK